MPKTPTQHLTSVMKTAAAHKKAAAEVDNLRRIINDYQTKKREQLDKQHELSHLLGLQIADAQLDGVDISVIAQALNVSPQYVFKRSDESRLKAGKAPIRVLSAITDEDREQAAKEMLAGTLTTAEAAERYGVTPKTAREWKAAAKRAAAEKAKVPA